MKATKQLANKRRTTDEDRQNFINLVEEIYKYFERYTYK